MYHVYGQIWSAIMGEILECEKELGKFGHRVGYGGKEECSACMVIVCFPASSFAKCRLLALLLAALHACLLASVFGCLPASLLLCLLAYVPLVGDALKSGHPLGEGRMEPWQGCVSPSCPQLPGCKNETTIFNKTENKAQKYAQNSEVIFHVPIYCYVFIATC